MRLLSAAEANTKLAKSGGRGYLLASLSLRPANLSGREVCPWRTPACTAACVLEHAGRGNMINVRDARDVKTDRFFDDRQAFLADLHQDLRSLERAAARQNLVPAVRLNVASDLPWERIDPTLFSAHPSIRFYDYTKGAARLLSALPGNYSLIYSFNELSNPADVVAILRRGGNVTMIFDTVYNPAHGRIDPLPVSHALRVKSSTNDFQSTVYRFDVVDGDAHDIRLPELDGAGVIVGLRGKGGKAIVAKGVADGFILPTIRGVVRELSLSGK
jgi:hypothetical protein